MEKQQILVVDDEEINRVILMEMFHENRDEYELLEAGNGAEAVRQIEENHNIVLVLLDVVMPIMDGFKVLEYMQEHELLEAIPVILITGETVKDSEGRAYDFGVADVIHKPFYPYIVRRRSKNIIELYQNKRNMERRLKEQEIAIRAQEQEIRETNEFMIDALSTVVESRSAETGDHTKRIKFYTRIMARHLMEHFPRYGLTPALVDAISRASVLHDIGKIGISDTILLKPGRLTAEEFEIMKTHTTIGCDILEKLYKDRTGEFYRYCYEICRHHHERWDGRGYPDHLAGEDIPISAQIVAVADVYDALVSPRVYKSSFSNDKAFEMIMNGECGQFSPDILECFKLAREDFFNIMEMLGTFEFS
ncbi:MAG: response regulator [Lachnospiraceae bacterium]|nr:response regulator [Lachnospiraceae bacterium]